MELAPFWVESPRRPLIVYRDYFKFILNRTYNYKKKIKKERRNMTPPDFFFLPWGFLETGVQQLSEGVRILCAQSSVLTPCCERACPSPRAAPLGLCQARGPIGCAKSFRLTALELCQPKTCSLPWLKAEPNTAGWAPEQSNFVFSSKVHLHAWCIAEQMPRWGSYKWPWRQSVTNLSSFLLCFIQIGILVLQQ